MGIHTAVSYTLVVWCRWVSQGLSVSQGLRYTHSANGSVVGVSNIHNIQCTAIDWAVWICSLVVL